MASGRSAAAASNNAGTEPAGSSSSGPFQVTVAKRSSASSSSGTREIGKSGALATAAITRASPRVGYAGGRLIEEVCRAAEIAGE